MCKKCKIPSSDCYVGDGETPDRKLEIQKHNAYHVLEPLQFYSIQFLN